MTDAPPDASEFVGLPAGGFTVQYLVDAQAGPHVLTLEVRWAFRRRLVS